jgi:hypothetical protein
MGSFRDDQSEGRLPQQVTAEFHELYEKESRKTSLAVNCLDRATDLVRTKFQDDSRMTNVSTVISRIEANDLIIGDELGHGPVLYGANFNIWGLNFSEVAESVE